LTATEITDGINVGCSTDLNIIASDSDSAAYSGSAV
jgi:hypothetical protein